MNFLPLYQVGVYQQNVFCWGRNGATNREFIFFRIHANDIFFKIEVLSADQTLIRRSKIEGLKNCVQCLKIVLKYIGYLHKK